MFLQCVSGYGHSGFGALFSSGQTTRGDGTTHGSGRFSNFSVSIGVPPSRWVLWFAHGERVEITLPGIVSPAKHHQAHMRIIAEPF